MEAVNGTERPVQPEMRAPTSDAYPPASEVREYFYSLFAGLSTIWPSLVCGH